jgi:hypothetical protein
MSWLLENGVSRSNIIHQNDWLIVEMPAAKAEALLQCEFYSFKHAETGDVIIRSKTLYSLPSHIAGTFHLRLISFSHFLFHFFLFCRNECFPFNTSSMIEMFIRPHRFCWWGIALSQTTQTHQSLRIE